MNNPAPAEKTLMETIRADWIAARKAKNENVASVLGVLIGNIQTMEKSFSTQRNLTDSEILSLVKKLRDGVRESAKLTPADHSNSAKLAIEEITLNSYMPSELSQEQLEEVVTTAILDGLDMGQIMKMLKDKFPGKYDGKMAADIIKKKIAAK